VIAFRFRDCAESGPVGGRDEIFPAEHHRALVAAYPGAQAHVFPELGHNLVLERPHEVGPVLVRFLEGAPS